MPLSPATILSLAAQCAPNVAPATIAALVQTESEGYAYAINVNGVSRIKQPTNTAQAVQVARYYISRGHSVDLGLGQINSANLRRLGLTVDRVFDPCTNIAATGNVIMGNFKAVRDGRHPQQALRIALSMYNTGSQSRGFANGYVRKVVRNAGIKLAVGSASVAAAPIARVVGAPGALPGVPAAGGALRSQTAAAQIAAIVEENTLGSARASPAQVVAPPSWDVFAVAKHVRAKLAEEGERR